MIYTTNAIESLNYQLRKVAKNRGHFPGDEAAVKLLWLAICNIEDERTPPLSLTRDARIDVVSLTSLCDCPDTSRLKSKRARRSLWAGIRTLG